MHATRRFSLLGAAAALALLAFPAQGKSVHVLYDFQTPTDGAYPQSGVVMDKAGNVYGTTLQGGTGGCAGAGCGTVFKLAPDGSKTTLYSFAGGSDGNGPHGIVTDKAGNLFGVTSVGGGSGCGGNGCGTIFEVASGGSETVLHAFAGGSDGAFPEGGLIMDAKGTLYGISRSTVFRLEPGGKEKVIHAFWGKGDGANAGAVTLAQDKAGNLYGTTQAGGTTGYGTVFKVRPDGTETVLYSFTGKGDGGDPYAGVVVDKAGNLYGTTPYEGDMSCDYGEGCGTVFKVAADGSETTLYTFTDTGVNANPMAGLVLDRAGNLYGTTYGFSPGGVFKLAPDGTETLIYTFTGGTDGDQPLGGLMMDARGRLYGTASGGGGGTCDNGFGCGAVFELEK